MWLSLLALSVAASPDAGAPVRLPPANTQPAFLEVPGALRTVEVPEGLRALGTPVRLSAAVTREKVPALQKHFTREFMKQRLFIPYDDEMIGPPLQQVTGLDVEHQVSYSVLFQENLDGTTTVITGVAALHAREQRTETAFAPVFPGAEGLLLSDAEAAQSLTYSTKASPKEVWSFYRETLQRAGWRESQGGVFESGSDALQVWVNERSGSTGVVVMKHTRAAP